MPEYTPVVRQAPSGPVINSVKNGAIIQLSNIMTVVTDGTILPSVPEEVRSDMSSGPPSLRPELAAPNPSSRIWVEGDLDILFDDIWASQNITSSVEVSFDDGATWNQIGGSVMPIPSTVNSTPAGTRVRTHFKVSAPVIPLSAVPNFVANADVVARITLEGDPTTGAANVVSDSSAGTVRLALYELFWAP